MDQEGTMKKSNKKIVLDFIAAINNGNIERMTELMSKDHIFIDAGDDKYTGKETMKEGWIGYFKMFPDYKIEVTDITENDSVIGVFGYASGTYKGLRNKMNSNYYRIPASWKAMVNRGKIGQWQVYCESKMVEQIVERNK
jgi:ketosteroid isomerase-like protein